jgi:hypothetical protein
MLCRGTQGEAGGEGEGLFQRVWLLDVVILLMRRTRKQYPRLYFSFSVASCEEVLAPGRDTPGARKDSTKFRGSKFEDLDRRLWRVFQNLPHPTPWFRAHYIDSPFETRKDE